MTTEVLDSTDRKIVSVLQAEGRISNLDLAERVGLSPTPCNRRVKRLEDVGVITGYGARVNQSALGIGVSVMVCVRLSEQGPSDIEEFLATIHRLPEISECLLVAGNLDYVLKVRAVDVEALKDFVLEKLKTIPCVSETTTMLILETVKSTD
ncbi:Lrp/AsnC family transcriptional regulator [Planktomarina temperata]|nr:Lrp/AsnC family transcriptional regulator [Planktomarina temperata]